MLFSRGNGDFAGARTTKQETCLLAAAAERSPVSCFRFRKGCRDGQNWLPGNWGMPSKPFCRSASVGI